MATYGPRRRPRRPSYSIAGEDARYRGRPEHRRTRAMATAWNHRALLAGARHGPRLLYPKHDNPPVPMHVWP